MIGVQDEQLVQRPSRSPARPRSPRSAPRTSCAGSSRSSSSEFFGYISGWPIDFLYENAAIVRHLRQHARDVEIDRRVAIEAVGVVRRQRRHHRRQHRHRVAVAREAREEVVHVLVDQRVARERGRERLRARALVGSLPLISR